MHKTIARLGLAAAMALPFTGLLPALAFADTASVNFEPSTYTVGNIHNQDGWLKSGTYDANVSATGIPVSFGTQSLQISDAVTSGAFGDQTFAKPLADSVGETAATNGAFSAGTKQTHFEMQFDLASVVPGAQQSGMHMSVSPDRGDGSRMSYLRFEDQADGIHVFFDDVTDTGPLGTVANFNETDIATISRSAHTIKLTMDVVDGPSNDVVKVYIDSVLKATGTSWEDYYRYDPESSAEQSPRIVKTVEFRESGTANVDDAGKGFLVDNFSETSSTPTPACNVDATQTIVSDTGTQVDAHGAFALSFVHPGWTASIPSAIWIWSSDPVADTTVDTTKVFTHDFTVVGSPLGADLMIASDNSYSVSVNGNPVGADTNGDNFTSASQDVINIPASALVTGLNTLSITVVNTATPDDANPQDNPAGLLYKLTVHQNECTLPPPPPTNSNVHIFKYLDGVQATIASANNVSFPMFTSTYNAPFTLGPSGWTAGDIAYEASTGPTPLGASYSANEDTTGAFVSAGPACDGTHPYALQGYSVGDTLAQAAGAPVTTQTPSFTNMQGEKFIIVHNVSCATTPPIKVHILKYLDGAVATAVTSGNYQFPMTATWMATNLNGGVSTSGNYFLGNNHGGAPDLYGADTAPMAVPADYVTSEVTDNTSQVVSSPELCAPGKYLLNGYRTSATSFADALTQPLETVPHQYTALASDRYVVVDNSSCPTKGSLTVEKDTIGGNATFTFTGDLGPFSITTVAGAGTVTFNNLAPGTYHVTEATKAGWTMTDSECSTVTVTAGGNAICVITNTSNKLLGAIRGTKYEDRDGDGKLTDGDHHRLSGWTIYLDTNNNGSLDSGEPSTVTDAHGNYRFVGLVAGTYKVREVGKSGWTQTVPGTGVYSVTISAGQIAKKKNFGNFHQGTISGMKYNDLNGNGKKDASEVGLSGWTIQLKKGNTVVATTVTGADGSYSFSGLSGGVYTLSEVMQAGWVQTDHPGSVRVRSSTAAVHEDFGNHNGPVTKHKKDNDDHHERS